MKPGAQLVKRKPVASTPLPDVEFHAAIDDDKFSNVLNFCGEPYVGGTDVGAKRCSQPPVREVVEQMPTRWELILWAVVLVVVVWASWLSPLWVRP